MKKNAKRFLSMLLALSMVFGLLVFPAGATENADTEEATTSTKGYDFSVEDSLSIVPLKTDGVDVDEDDPVIIAVSKELAEMMVLNAEGNPVPLTVEEQQQVLYLFQQYLDQWEANANRLGVQVPFFLQYNDKGEDGLGILGEMLALAGLSVDAVRAGYMTMDDMVGMIYNFYYGDQLGLKYYGSKIDSARKEVMDLINNSGAKTEVQKLLVLNDWLAHNVVFDMPYIMNSDKEEGEKPMVAENPQKHERYDDVYDVMFDVYEAQIRDTFENKIVEGLKAEMKKQFYIAAIEQAYKTAVYDAALAQAAEEALPTVKEQAWDAVYDEAYAAAKEAAEKEIYDNAYQEYIDANHAHAYKVEWKWAEELAEDGTATATATLTCTEGGEVVEVEAEVAIVEDVTKTYAATCTAAGKSTFKATVTKNDASFTDEKAYDLAALGHDYDSETGVCKRCQAINDSHEHNYNNQFVWTINEKTGDVDSVEFEAACTTCGDKQTPDVSLTVNSETKVTCTTDGAKNVTAAVVLDGTPVTETKDLVLKAQGHTNAKSEKVEPTCTVAGKEEGVICTVCQSVISGCTEIPADGHKDENGDKICDVETCKADLNENSGVEGEQDAQTVEASEELEAAADEYAKGKVEEAAEAIHTSASEAATAAADEYVEENADALLEEAKKAIEADPDAKAQLDAAAESETEKFMTENEAAINADPVAFVEGAFGAEAAAEFAAMWESTWADWEKNGIPGMVDMFAAEIWKAVIEQFYIQGMTQQGMTEEQAAAQAAQIMEADADDIAADPYGYCVTNFGQDGADQAQAVVNDQLKQMGIDGSKETNPEGRVKLEVIVALQMDTPQEDPMLQKPDGSYMTPNEAIPVFADQAAQGLTGGILDYWQGSHIGALGRGSAVCLGYTKAFTYLVQYMHPEVYGVNGANTDMSKAANWKKAKDLYYTDGELDITKNYIIDDVRITFDASVTMYGETEDNFNSDHFWNAVQIDGKWYYVDPCYTDVYTEVMMRDRVETDGGMNHMYFMFSHTTAAQLYDGNYKEIKTLYDGVATHTDYEDSWISRIKSNTYFDGGYAYYLYDSTDLITLMNDANSDQGMSSDMMEQNYKYKLVRHKLTETDAGDDGDTNYQALIEFNFKADEDDDETIVRVYDPAADKMVENVMLTKLYAQHEEECKVYPSLALTAALYNGKLYFNVSNKILTYTISTGEVAVVKEYNTVRAQRDKTNPFGGMAFTVTTGNTYDLEVENHPIAGLTIKNDGNMYVSIATNFAFISGKDPHNSEDQSSYGYEFEESNYNISYNSYSQGQYDESMMESYGYTKEINDNDEFMWSANFVETLSMSHLTGTRHTYSEVTVDAYCGRNAFTEKRCNTCGIAQADSRVEVEGSALDHHHYVEFIETFYTKDDSGNWNTGRVYVCTVCGFHIEEPTEPTKNDQMSEEDYQKQLENYEKEKAIYEDAVATAGHTYVDADAVWAEDLTSVTVQNMECSSVCIARKNYLDCLLQDDTMIVTLDKAITLPVGIVGTIGTCEEGVIQIYGATETFEYEFIKDKPVAVKYGETVAVQLEPGTHSFENCVCTMCGEYSVKRIAGSGRVETAIAAADVLKDVLGVETFDSIIIANGDNFADALAGSYLATAKGAPILLHRNSGVGDELNENYIDANLSEGGTIYLLGGTAAIPESIEDALIASNYKVVRLKGDTRLDTNLAILEEAGVSEDDEILIVTGWNYADALSASATGKPILMVNEIKGELTEKQIEFLKKHASNQYAIIGGTGAISQALEDAIDTIVEKDIIRVYGETREATSVRVAKRYFDEPTFALVAYSRNYPDGLAAGPLAYALGAPLLLTNAGQEAVGADYISTNEIGGGYIIGGAAAITDATVKTCFGITAEGEIPAL